MYKRLVLFITLLATLPSATAAESDAVIHGSLAQATTYTAFATIGFITFFLLLLAASAALRRGIDARHASGRLVVRWQKAELVSGARMARTLRRGVQILALIFLALALYFYISLVFSFFPATRGYATVLLAALTTPLWMVWRAFVDYLPNIGVLAVVIALTTLLTKFVHVIFNELGKGTLHFKGFHPDWSDTTYKIARFTIITFAAVVAFPYLPGANSPAFQGVSIFVGVLLSFGSGPAISNLIAGVVLTYTRAFQIGDRVKVNETEGDIVGKTLIATHLRTIKNVVVTVPNSIMLANHIINYSSEAHGRGLILPTTVTIGYDVPWRKVHDLLLDAARDTEHVLQDPTPFVLQTSLDDFYVSYQLNAYTREAQKKSTIYSALHQHIQDRFHHAGVEILSPHYTALRSGNAVAMPPEHLPADYVAPPFIIRGDD
ncbi:MAG: mechanosensitive ion channel family protein [Gammaproteobacteria bacterium]|nr:mechanosensitive ion channel family protein [Gammaproteobacteria bacterium]